VIVRPKDKLVVFDHAGNHLRLGMVTDIRQDRLDDGSERGDAGNRKRERTESLPKLCEGCKAVVHPGARSCPSCGAEIHAKTRVEAVDGELVEFGARRSGKREVEVFEKKRFYAELLGYADRRGFKRAWAFHKFVERYKHPPAGYEQVSVEPSLATMNWIKSRQIAFANAEPDSSQSAGSSHRRASDPRRQGERAAARFLPPIRRLDGHPVRDH
jgi:DNA repair protein RadD